MLLPASNDCITFYSAIRYMHLLTNDSIPSTSTFLCGSINVNGINLHDEPILAYLGIV